MRVRKVDPKSQTLTKAVMCTRDFRTDQLVATPHAGWLIKSQNT